MGEGVFPCNQGFLYRKGKNMVKKDLLDILACPECHTKVSLSDDGNWIICDQCSVKYPVEDDIPIMLTERAVSLER